MVNVIQDGGMCNTGNGKDVIQVKKVRTFRLSDEEYGKMKEILSGLRGKEVSGGDGYVKEQLKMQEKLAEQAEYRKLEKALACAAELEGKYKVHAKHVGYR